MKPQPDKFLVIRYPSESYDGEIAYGPELEDRCEHWLKQVYRNIGSEPHSYYYEIKPAIITWS